MPLQRDLLQNTLSTLAPRDLGGLDGAYIPHLWGNSCRPGYSKNYKTAHDASKMASDGPKRAGNDFNVPLDGPKWPQDVPGDCEGSPKYLNIPLDALILPQECP